MIDPTHAFASWFLWIGGAVFLVVYGIPLLVSPLRWARRFLWALPEDTHLTVYLGRCLGAVAIAIVLGCFRAAPEPTRHALLSTSIRTTAGTSGSTTSTASWCPSRTASMK